MAQSENYLKRSKRNGMKGYTHLRWRERARAAKKAIPVSFLSL